MSGLTDVIIQLQNKTIQIKTQNTYKIFKHKNVI